MTLRAAAVVPPRVFDGPGGITFFTAADGTYTVRNLPPGDYTVRARADFFAWEFFSETPNDRLASRVSVAVGTPATGINFTMDTASGTISGTVVRQSDGAPVRNAKVRAFNPDLGSGNGTRTNSDGSYTIQSLPPGSYWLEVDSGGFATEYYPGTLDFDLAIRVTVAAKADTSGIDFTLQPGGTISGKVTEADGVTPVIDARVVADSFTASWPPASRPLTSARTRMDGTYTISGVTLVAQGVAAVPIGQPLVLEFYNNTADPTAALPVTPNATGINFSLDTGGTISGTVHQTDGTTPIPDILVMAENTTTGVVLGLAPTERDGTYRTTGLPAGEYRVFAKDPLGRGFAQEYYSNASDAASATAVTVVVPGDTPNINFTLNPALVVTKTADTNDGVCDADCSLREAINAANARAGADIIAFNISGLGPHIIQPASFLPTITGPVVIDGYTQPGARPNTNGPGLGFNNVLKIELDGSTGGVGFSLAGGNNTVRGIAINRFTVGIKMGLASGNSIQGNFIGTDVTGKFALGNRIGIHISSGSDNTIGGLEPHQRNLISGNNNQGVVIEGIASVGNLVQGNFIGTDVSGTLGLGNAFEGVLVTNAPNNTIGGTTAAARNVISGNGSQGVVITAALATGNLVLGNFIGTDVTGTAALANINSGLYIKDSANNTIGGTAIGTGNIIAFNGGRGVVVELGTNNGVLSNSIFSNTSLGIDVGADGVTPNDVGDGDTGPNNLQNFPVLTSATSGGGITINGTLDSAASTQFRLELFSNSACDPSGHGEGESLLGSIDVTTDGSGNASFNVNFPVAAPAGQLITATATDPNNNTSEFSLCQVVA